MLRWEWDLLPEAGTDLEVPSPPQGAGAVTAFGAEHLGPVTKLQHWTSSSHVRPSCACAQRDLTEFVSKSYQKLINPIVLKTEEMLHFVLIYFYILSIPDICFTMG